MSAGAAPAGAFAAATRLRELDDGGFEAQLDERFTVTGRPNGGYLLAIAAAAAEAELARHGSSATCLAASAAYARSLEVGAAQVRADVDRRGTRVAQVHCSIGQRGRTAVRALLTMGRLRDGDHRVPAPLPPVLPDPEDCARVPAGGPPGAGVSILECAEVRLDPATPLRPAPPGPAAAEVRGWVRLDESGEPDPRALLFLLDVLPPATLPVGSSGWVPTIQLAATVRARPRSTWLAARQVARWVAGGLVQQACELWDRDGALVAEATQLAMVRFA